MLHVIGLGLGDARDISVRALAVVQHAARVYLEAYTSMLVSATVDELEQVYGRGVVVADRDMVEQEADVILHGAEQDDVAFLVVGDPFGATTHTDLVLRAKERGISVRVYHNASVMNAVGACGLSLYTFGQTVSLVFFTGTWRPDSFYDRIVENHQLGLHTLCLLDIKMREQSEENLARGRKIYEPPRFMTIPVAAQQLIEVEAKRQQGICTPDTMVVGVARLGADSQRIRVGTLAQFAAESVDEGFGPPLHSLVLIGKRAHALEMDALRSFAVDVDAFDAYRRARFPHSF